MVKVKTLSVTLKNSFYYHTRSFSAIFIVFIINKPEYMFDYKIKDPK